METEGDCNRRIPFIEEFSSQGVLPLVNTDETEVKRDLPLFRKERRGVLGGGSSRTHLFLYESVLLGPSKRSLHRDRGYKKRRKVDGTETLVFCRPS